MKIALVSSPNDTLKETGFGHYDACEHARQSLLKQNHSISIKVCNSEVDLNSVVKENFGFLQEAICK